MNVAERPRIRARLEPVTLLPSLVRPLVRAFLRGIVRRFCGVLSVGGQRALLDAVTAVQFVPSGTWIAPVWMRGVPAERVRDTKRRRDRAVLYLHGGAFCTLGPRSFRALAARIARRVGADVFVLAYRLAPEHAYPAALDDALDAYRWLLREGYSPERIMVVGDSAGGGLALALLVHLRDNGIELPASAALISPWVDLTLETAAASPEGLAADDPVLTLRWLERCAAAYRGPSLHAASLVGLPPLLVIASSDEILLGDAERLVSRAAASGVAVRGRRYDGLWHDFAVLAGMLPEADRVIADIADFAREPPVREDEPYSGFASNSSASEFMQ